MPNINCMLSAELYFYSHMMILGRCDFVTLKESWILLISNIGYLMAFAIENWLFNPLGWHLTIYPNSIEWKSINDVQYTIQSPCNLATGEISNNFYQLCKCNWSRDCLQREIIRQSWMITAPFAHGLTNFYVIYIYIF